MVKAKGKKTDWEAIRKEYVEAPTKVERPTLEALAETHGCSASYLREKASAEKWKEAAENFLSQVQTTKQAVKVVAIATDHAQWDADCFKAAKGMLTMVYGHLRKAGEQNKTIDIKQLDELAKTLERVHKLGRMALGEEKQVDPHQELKEAAAGYAQRSPAELAQLYHDKLKSPITPGDK